MTLKIQKRTLLLCLCWTLVFPVTAKPQKVKPYKDLSYPALRDIVIPEVHRQTLPNGIQLFLLEDHELPLIRFSGLIRTGSIYEPADKIGLAGITGQVLRTGGTEERTGDELDELLESMAASIETGIHIDSGMISASALKENVDTVLELIADVLMSPAFRAEKITLAKMQQRSVIARRNDQPGDIATREFDKLIYGPNSVYARHPEFATIHRIKRSDLIAFHKQFFAPNNFMLAVWGDFTTADMSAKIEKAFAAWEKKPIQFSDPPSVKYGYPRTVNVIAKADVNQSNIIMGHIGGTRKDPDYFPLLIANRILGSSFTGRLFNNVRSRLGLAYSVYGIYTANYNYPGVFYVGCQTKSESTLQAIEAMTQEVVKMTQAEVTDQELALAKDSFLNSFVFNFDTKGKIVNRLMTYAYYGYPPDFLQTIKGRVEQVTKADVLRVAKKHYHHDKLQTLVVGRPGDFDRPLSVLGEVREIDITIPPPPAPPKKK